MRESKISLSRTKLESLIGLLVLLSCDITVFTPAAYQRHSL